MPARRRTDLPTAQLTPHAPPAAPARRGARGLARLVAGFAALATGVTLLAAPAGAAVVDGLSVNGATAELVPADGLLFGSSNGSRGGVHPKEALVRFEHEIGRKLDLHRLYDLWDDPQPNTMAQWDVANGRTVALSIRASRRGGAVVPWRAIAAGREDAAIARQADGLKRLGAPVIVTFHHEPEDDPQHGTPAEFVAAWRHWVQVFRSRGADNVSFAWVMMAFNFESRRGAAPRAAAYYPGDDVVDWLAPDGYNWYGCGGRPKTWRTFGDTFAAFRAWATPHRKPVFIAEYGSMEDPQVPGRKGAWFGDALAHLRSWPEVKAISYFNSSVDCPWWVNSSPSSVAGFKAFGAHPWSHGSGTGGAGSTGGSVTVSDTWTNRRVPTAATLHAALSGSGASTYHFEYGPTPAYGARTAETPVTSPQDASAVASGLNRDSLYHYRVVVQSPSGTVVGPDASFRTAGEPAIWDSVARAPGSGRLSVTVQLRAGSAPTTYAIEHGRIGGGTTTTGGTSAGDSQWVETVSGTVRGLRPGTTHRLRLVAWNKYGRTNGAWHTLRVR